MSRRSSPVLPPPLVAWLGTYGYAVEKRVVNFASAEKDVFGAYHRATKAGVVVLHSKCDQQRRLWLWNYATELAVLQEVKAHWPEGHPNIIRMLGFKDAPDSPIHGPCMILERIEPLGFDLFHVHQQYAAVQRTLPLAQWLRYLRQLLSALEFLHSMGWVHCDLKAENVLIQTDHVVKLIDFGCARKIGVDSYPRRADNMPPEFDDDVPASDRIAQPSADMWLLGGMTVQVFAHAGVRASWVDSAYAIKFGIAGVLKTWKCELDPALEVAIDGLMQRAPGHRWGMPRLKEWLMLSGGERPQADPDILETPPETEAEEARYFRKSPPLSRLVKVFGLRVENNLPSRALIGKYVGPHTSASGERIEGPERVLNVKSFLGVTALFIDRRGTLIPFPGANDKIKCGDCLFIKLEEDAVPNPESCMAFQGEAAKQARKEQAGVEMFLEYDEFEFPEHSWGAAVGQAESHQNSLHIRKIFGINLAFISRSAEGGHQVHDVGNLTTVLPGDLGIVCRVPDRRTGHSYSILTDKLLEPLMEPEQFRKTLDLDDGGWSQWMSQVMTKP